MAQIVKKIFRIAGWIIAGFLALMLLVTLLFYLFRGRIKNEAVDYFNSMQQGELQVGQISFVPFLHFPDIMLKVKEVQYIGVPDSLSPVSGSTIMMIEGFGLSLDLKALLKGEYRFAAIDVESGVIRLKIYEDGSTNLERALGDLLSSEADSSATGTGTMKLDLERVSFRNLLISVDNDLLQSTAGFRINQLRANLSYYPEMIRASLDLDLNLNELSSDYYSFDNPRNLLFHGGVSYNPVLKKIEVEPSSLRLKQTELEVWGTYETGTSAMADITFRAKNSGLDLLNFLLNGVLDLDEIEQTGSGSIYLSGTVRGSIGRELPDIKVNFGADGLGFRIKAIDKKVEDISFMGYINNGRKPDLSEAVVVIDRLKARLPGGELSGKMMVQNLLNPEVDIQLNASAELAGMEKMLSDSILSELGGRADIKARLFGKILPESGEFLSPESHLDLRLADLNFRLPDREPVYMDGALLLKGKDLFLDSLILKTGNTDLFLDADFSGLVTAALGYRDQVKGSLRIHAGKLKLADLTGDSTWNSEPYGELTGLSLNCNLITGLNAREKILETGLPDYLQLLISEFSGEMKGMAPLKDFSGELRMGGQDVSIEKLKGRLGNTNIQISAAVRNFQALYNDDTLSPVDFSLSLKSESLLLSDLLTYDGEFMLSDSYAADRMDRFNANFQVVLPPGTFQKETFDPDLDLSIKNLHFCWSAYPFEVAGMDLRAERKGDRLIIDQMKGKVGQSDINISGYVDNFLDSLTTAMKGQLRLRSDMISLDEILEVYYSGEEEPEADAPAIAEEDNGSFFSRLSRYNYPQISLDLNVGTIVYEMASLKDLKGRLKVSPSRVFTMDSLSLVSISGGTLFFNGQFSVIDPERYVLGASMEVNNFNIKDLKLDMEYDERHYSLQDNFAGVLTVKGLAEFFITPEMSLDLAGSTAFLNVIIRDGEVKNFAPLHELAKYFGNKDLDDVRFAELRNNFTLVDGRVYIPKTSIGSTIGQIVIEGEHGFDNTYDYLLRLPSNLVKGAAWSAMTYREGKQKEGTDEMQNATSGKFVVVTIKGNGEETDIRMGDKREDK
ncbi:MAG: hypothetical protein ACOYXB_07950 [Bacteroidota bacterium]